MNPCCWPLGRNIAALPSLRCSSRSLYNRHLPAPLLVKLRPARGSSRSLCGTFQRRYWSSCGPLQQAPLRHLPGPLLVKLRPARRSSRPLYGTFQLRYWSSCDPHSAPARYFTAPSSTATGQAAARSSRPLYGTFQRGYWSGCGPHGAPAGPFTAPSSSATGQAATRTALQQVPSRHLPAPLLVKLRPARGSSRSLCGTFQLRYWSSCGPHGAPAGPFTAPSSAATGQAATRTALQHVTLRHLPATLLVKLRLARVLESWSGTVPPTLSSMTPPVDSTAYPTFPEGYRPWDRPLQDLTASDFREVLFSSDLTASDFPGSSVGVMDDQTPQLRTETNEPTQAASRSACLTNTPGPACQICLPYKHGRTCLSDLMPYKHARTCLSDLPALQTRPDLPVRSACLTNTAGPACQICPPGTDGSAYDCPHMHPDYH
ncbi:Hypp4423 [Branchiostoma lanceolatum]|uniref:Hypp4423 protein n=1 Tax=Branchiostoma lanceolatum TaxID=7740 RepID=A0A8K0A9V9_BRALA|nr:Hypp4423 [Branchiostoma lanceolatum]